MINHVRCVSKVFCRLGRAHATMKGAVNVVDAQADVAVFAKQYGSEMPFEIPVRSIFVDMRRDPLSCSTCKLYET